MPTVTLACNAMATRFEVVLHGDKAVALRAAGAEALEEIERLENQLSLFRPSSEIAHLNARAGQESVRVTPGLFALLQHARKLHEETRGAFDITIAPLMKCWGFLGGSGRWPSPDELAEARSKVGMHLVRLEPRTFTVRFAREGVMLDLGAVGKGYAIDRAVELLREAGVTSALIHGGTSSVYALGHPPGAEFWQIEVENREPAFERTSRQAASSALSSASLVQAPNVQPPSNSQDVQSKKQDAPPKRFGTVSLRDESLSVSGVRGKFFEAEGKTLGHIIDPRSGNPAAHALLAAVALPSATETDALSTALLAVGPEGHKQIAGLRPGMRTLVVARSGDQLRVERHGISDAAPAG